MKNKEQKEIIYLDQEGYDLYLAKIAELKERLNQNNNRRKEALFDSIGNGADYSEFEEIEGINAILINQINNLYEELSRVVIVEKTENSDLVNIGDIVKLRMKLFKDEYEDIIFKLVGCMSDFEINKEIEEVSVNSPLGNSIYQKKIGEKCTYSVNNEQYDVLIIEKIDLTKQQDGTKKILKK